MTFHRMAYPFADHIGVRLQEPRHRARKAGLVAAMEQAGLRLVHSHATPDECDLLFFGTAPERHLSADRALYAEGYFFADRPLMPGDQALAQLALSAPHICGNGTMVACEESTFAFLADRLGLSQLYCRSQAPQIVANRIELAIRALESVDCPPRLDACGAGRILLYQTPLGSRTPVAELSLLPAGTSAMLDCHGLRTSAAPRFDETRGDYRTLLSRAAEEIVSHVSAIATRYTGGNLVVSLSGGIDSRIVLAAILAARLENTFSFYTYGKRNSPDRAIARGLRRLFDLREAVRAPAHYYPADVAFERGFQLNWGMRKLDGNEGFIESAPRDELLVDGGCGETMRGFFTMPIGKKYGEDRLLNMDGGELFNRFLHDRLSSADVSPRLQQAIRDEVRKEICAFASGNPLTDLDMLYPAYRNRLHFGLGARIRTTNALTFSPLATPAGISASLSIDPPERAMGRVAYDLICLLCPRLASIPTTSGRWPDLYASRQQYVDLPPGEDAPRKGVAAKPNITGAAAAAAAGILARLPPDKRSALGRLVSLKSMAAAAEGSTGDLQPRLIAAAQFLKAAERLEMPAKTAGLAYPLIPPVSDIKRQLRNWARGIR
ncbi:MAG TPA: hypothetical protein VGM17_04360 [Rhizomicrobium sp.]|jgi:hypothetical protein